MNTLKRKEKIIRESAFDNKKKKAGLKFNPGLVLTGVRTTEPRIIVLKARERIGLGTRLV